MESTGIIFSKTEKGREEMAKRSHGLNPSQRRVLIIIDGNKGFDALADMVPAMVPSGQLRDILAYLMEHGFIAAAEGDQKAQSHAATVTAASSALTDDPATIRLVKDFMTTTAQTYLGLLSASLIQRIEQARTPIQLMSVAGQWNMALRDSAQGKRFADPYLEQVRSALVAGAKPALDMSA
jgi:hypothetical protein